MGADLLCHHADFDSKHPALLLGGRSLQAQVAAGELHGELHFDLRIDESQSTRSLNNMLSDLVQLEQHNVSPEGFIDYSTLMSRSVNGYGVVAVNVSCSWLETLAGLQLQSWPTSSR